MNGYILLKAQTALAESLEQAKNDGVNVTIEQEALLFSKELIKQELKCPVKFCADHEFFIAKTPLGFEITGYYTTPNGTEPIKKPFVIAVQKQDGVWLPTRRYIAPDNRACSTSILLWVLLMLGCTLGGILITCLIYASMGI